MGKIMLARVDAKLIRGQVMTSLSKSAGAAAIFIADDPAAHDPFTRNIIPGADSCTDPKVRVLKEDGAVRYWNDRRHDDYHVILLIKGIKVMVGIIRGGVSMEELNLDGIPQKLGLTLIIKEVAINKEQLKILQELEGDYDIDIYFQAIPSPRRVSLEEAARLFEGHSA